MTYRISLTGICVLCVAFAAWPVPSAFGSDLGAKSCNELMRMAESHQQDLSAVDTVLGSAIDIGNMERVRSYKLRKGAVKQRLESIMKALQFKGCLK